MTSKTITTRTPLTYRSIITSFSRWHSGKVGLLLSVVLGLVIAYGMVSLAIDRGNLWWYFLTVVFLILAIRDLINLVKKALHDYQAKKA